MAKDNGHPLAYARANGGGPLNLQPDLTDLFIKLPSELVNLVGDGKLSINAAWLYVLLLSCINHKRGDAKVWPSRRWLAERMRMSQVRAIDRYINELENAGLLDRDRRRNGRVNDTNVYTLRLVHQGGSAQQSTTPRPGKTAMSAGQWVVHGSTLPSAQQSTRGSAQESTGVVHGCAPELEEVELDEVQPDERTTSSCVVESAPPPTTTQPKEEEERNINQTQQQAQTIANRYRPHITTIEARRLAHPIAEALQNGWTPTAITTELDANHAGLANLAAGLITRARNLGHPPTPAPTATNRLTYTAHRAAVANQPNCDHGEPGGNTPHPNDGWMHCVFCRRRTGWTPHNPPNGERRESPPAPYRPYRDPDDLSVYYQDL